MHGVGGDNNTLGDGWVEGGLCPMPVCNTFIPFLFFVALMSCCSAAARLGAIILQLRYELFSFLWFELNIKASQEAVEKWNCKNAEDLHKITGEEFRQSAEWIDKTLSPIQNISVFLLYRFIRKDMKSFAIGLTSFIHNGLGTLLDCYSRKISNEICITYFSPGF